MSGNTRGTTNPPANRSVGNLGPNYVGFQTPTPGIGAGEAPLSPYGRDPLIPRNPIPSAATSKITTIPVIDARGRIVGAWTLRYGQSRSDTYKLITLSKPSSFFDPTKGRYVPLTQYFAPKSPNPFPGNRPPITGTNGPNTNNPPATEIGQQDPSKWKWNLPPHKWSQPLLPVDLIKLGDYKKPPVDRYRRGRLWWKYTPPMRLTDIAGNQSDIVTTSRMYGFQFMWNPESWSTSVSVNMEITPTAADRFISVPAVFPATQVVSLDLRLDRTNDFACAAANLPRPSEITVGKQLKTGYSYLTTKDIKQFTKYYTTNGGWVIPKRQLEEKVKDLLQRGTLADLEYLYRAINGDGVAKNKKWTNNRGIQTADIGYLTPTLLNIDIGPVAYQGYVTAINVKHTAFTPDMIPIRTDVSLQINLMATASITAQLQESVTTP